MNLVFLDTVGLVGLWNRNDSWHADATQAFSQITNSGQRLTTTTFVLLECGNTVARQPFRRDVCELREQLEAEKLLVSPTDDDWRRAWQAYERGEAAQAGIVDQVSFVVMRRLGITQAFTNDAHFKAAGFETLF